MVTLFYYFEYIKIMIIDLYIYFLLALLFYNILNKINPNNEKLKYNKDYCLIVGYKGVIKKKPIIVNMLTTPHLLVCGLSGSGKTKCIEYAIKDKRVIILNAFKDDFKSIKCPKINGENNIINVLMNCCKQYQEKPLYIVIDELLVMSNNKKINKCILDILAVARHYNVFLIGIAQRGLSVDMSFKNLFNARLCFRQVEETSYRAVLGYSIDNPNLQKREFILLSDYIYKGRTYDI